jgi:myxalamid-type polyketide synthase MxaB
MEPLAIVGMACRFPGGADSPSALWDLLVRGVDAITDVPAERWSVERFYDPNPDAPGKTYVRQGGFLGQPLGGFDAHFFGISPREAAFVDPQQRLLLEVAWEAFEDAGLPPDQLSGSRTGTFMGVMALDGLGLQMVPGNRALMGPHSATANAPTLCSNRISYAFNLLGPSVSLDTACSSSLVAVHYACQSIWSGECARALAGGVNLMFGPNYPILMSKGRFLSPDGRCKAFDERANGYGRGEGAGVVILEPLSVALQEGHPIHAVIRGTAVNQDGHTPGITVPSQSAQEALLREACRRAGVSPREVQYVEAHGTGTSIGDVIEANALGNVLGAGRQGGQPCLIGSVKTNIGHLEAAAGVAGLIKTVLCLKHRQVPGNLHFVTPNPKIPFDDLHLRVPTGIIPWPPSSGGPVSGGSRPRLAGVNSFGFGGTNAHVILEEAPASGDRSQESGVRGQGSAEERPHLLPLSARSPRALAALAGSYAEFLAGGPSLPDLYFSASVTRSHHEHRLALIAESRDELARQLEAARSGGTLPGMHAGSAASGKESRLVFVYTGMGPQWWAMGRELLNSEPVFRAAVERVDALFRLLADWSMLEELSADEGSSRLKEALFAQTSNFAIQVALTELWRSWGVVPHAVVGHSVGEVAAAWAAGAFDLEDAVRISYQRARLQSTLAGRGKMLAVGLGLEAISPLLEGHTDRVDVAAINSPTSVTLSGEVKALEEIAQVLTARSVFNRFLHVEVPYHSHEMEAIHDDLLAALQGVRPRSVPAPLYSTVTGGRIDGADLGPAYWWRNVREPVRLQSAVLALSADGYETFLEVGPHPVLAASILDCLRHHGRQAAVLPSLCRQKPERRGLLETLGRLYALGHPLDWHKLWPRGGRRLALPAYPWQREVHWSESAESREDRLGSERHPLLGRSVPAPNPTWEAELNGLTVPYLPDHRVEGKPVFPGAAYVEAALALGHEVMGGAFDLEDIEISKVLIVETAPAPHLRVAYQPATGAFTMHSRTGHDQPAWALHARGHLVERKDRVEPPALRLEEARARLKPVSVADAYRWFEERGLNYGPFFRPAQRLWSGPGEGLGELRLAPQLHASLPRTHCHPTLLDAAFQVLLQAFSGLAGDKEDTLYLPVGIGRVRFHAPPGASVWCHARITRRTAQSAEGDVLLLGPDGTTLVEVRGLRVQALPRPARPAERWTNWVHEVQWEKRPLASRGCEPPESASPGCEPPPAGRRWLIVGGGPRGTELARHLAQHEQSVHVCAAASAEDVRRIESPEWDLVYLASLEADHPEDNGALPEQDGGLADCAALLAALAALPADGPAPRGLWVVTRGAQQVADEGPVLPGQAALVGLARVIANERPDLACCCIDLEAGQPMQMAGLAAELLGRPSRQERGDAEPEVALRGADSYVPRLRRVAPNEARRPSLPARKPAPVPPTEALALEVKGGARGNLDNLVFRPSQRRAPAPGEVEVRVEAVGLNFKDVLKAMGLLSARITEDTHSGDRLGLECAATVLGVGDGITDLRPGDTVLAFVPGCFTTHLTLRRDEVFPGWPGATHEELATVLVTFLTAYYGLHEIARLEKGESVLIHAASGGVGLAAIQVARWKGATIFATAGNPEKRAYLRSLGLEHVLDSRSLTFADQVRERTRGRGVDVVLNSLAGKALLKSVEVLAPYGRFIEIGKRDIDENNGLPLRPFNRNLLFAAIDLDRLFVDRPERARRLAEEVLDLFHRGTFQPLPHVTFPASNVPEAFRHLAQAKQIGKVVLSLRDADLPAVSAGWSLRPDATYLVTGGTGGVGLEAARWLAENGARHLVLLSRSGATAQAQEGLATLRRLGAQVRVAAVDVGDRSALAALLAEVREGMPPLRGVLHLAAVLDDVPHQAITPDRLAKVLGPKAVGAWNLHVLLRGQALDFFVLFSSVSALVGNPGQANYAAANAFLDALARRRQSAGEPALSINWGALTGAGMLARNTGVARVLEAQGLRGIPVAEALQALAGLLANPPAGVGIIDIDWEKWSAAHPRAAADPRFRDVRGAGSAPAAGGAGGTFGAALRALPEKDRQGHVAGHLQRIIARVMRLGPEQVPLDRGLGELGIDSLLAVEVQTLIQTELATSLSTMDLMGGPSVSQLAGIVLGKCLEASRSQESGVRRQDSGARGQGAGVKGQEPAEEGRLVGGNGEHQNGLHAPVVSPHGENGRMRESAPRVNGGPAPRASGLARPSQSCFEQFPEYLAVRQRIAACEAAGIQVPFFRVQESVAGPVTTVEGRERINYSSFNYLGLSGHPRVNRAAQEAIERFGTSVSASRMVSGERPLHAQLEAGLAGWLGTDDAVVFLCGYLTNVSVIGHLLGPSDLVLYDELVHNSARTGCKLSGARALAFPHNDWEALDGLLRQQRANFRRAMIVMEGVYSMDGDFPDLPRFIEIKKEHDALLMIDEAHSLGVMGATGRGLGEHFGVERRDVDLWMGTLSKALASSGGYIAGGRAIVDYLRTTTPGLVYSVGLSPPDSAAALAALEMMGQEPERAERVRQRGALFLRLARERGLNTGKSGGTAVVPVIVGNSLKAMALSQALFDRGINAAPIFFPAVEDAAARVRFFITSLHTEEQIGETVEVVAQEWGRLEAGVGAVR